VVGLYRDAQKHHLIVQKMLDYFIRTSARTHLHPGAGCVSSPLVRRAQPGDMIRLGAPMGSMTYTLAIKGETGSLDKYNDKFRELAKLRATQLYEMFHSKFEFHAWRDKFVGSEGEKP
jgi:hypothetical protein